MYNSVKRDMIVCIVEELRSTLMEISEEELIDLFQDTTGLSVDDHYRADELCN